MRHLVCAGLIASLAARAIGAQATVTVPPSDPIYRTLDDLAAAGRITTMIVGQRPYTRREIARLLGEAGERDLQTRFGDVALRIVESVTGETMVLNSPSRALPNDSSGSTDAAINPFLDYREGRQYAEHGATAAVETYHLASAGPHIGVAMRPRFSTAASQRFFLEQAAAHVALGNVTVDAGRDYNFVGQGRYAGVAGSMNAQGLDMVRLSTESPWTLPSFLRPAGPVKGTLYVADVGNGDVGFPHSKILGYEISLLPRSRIEIGLHALEKFGGRGTPPVSLLTHVLDATMLYYPFFHPGNDSSRFAERLVGGDFRLRIPGAAGLEVYGDAALRDFDIRRLKSILVDETGGLLGFRVACLRKCGAMRLQGEWHKTGIRFYSSGRFLSGLTYHQHYLGDALGLRGRAAYLWLDGTGRAGTTWSVQGAYEARNGSLYEAVAGKNDVNFHFIDYARRPSEHRLRLLADVSGALDAHTRVRLETGIEQVGNFAFSNERRTNGLGRVVLEWRP